MTEINLPIRSVIKSSFRSPTRKHLDVCLANPIGNAAMFFKHNNEVGPKGEIVLSSGFVHAEPTGRGLGTELFQYIVNGLQIVADRSGKTIIHPLYPTSEKSAAFFAKQGYVKDLDGTWRRKGDGDYWYYRTFQPSQENKPPENSQELVECLFLLRPDLQKKS